MTKREVIRLVLQGKRPPYVPWSMGFTHEAQQKLQIRLAQLAKNHL